MTSTTTKPDCLQPAADMAGDLFDNWFDPLEAEVRARSREFIEELLRGLAKRKFGALLQIGRLYGDFGHSLLEFWSLRPLTPSRGDFWRSVSASKNFVP